MPMACAASPRAIFVILTTPLDFLPPHRFYLDHLDVHVGLAMERVDGFIGHSHCQHVRLSFFHGLLQFFLQRRQFFSWQNC